MAINEGESTVNFELPANDDTVISIESFKEKKNVVLCFYPKNHLFACPSTVDSQKEFVKKYEIPYLHLSDTKKDVCKKYAGLNIAGLAKRSTFIIDKQGIVKKIFRGFDVKNHGEDILNVLERLD